MSKEYDTNDIAAEFGLEWLRAALEAEDIGEEDAPTSAVPNLLEVSKRCRSRNEPVVSGLLRRGEVMNIVAPPKIGKTWLTYHLVCAQVSGQPWLGVPNWTTKVGNVHLIDNELHESEIAHRLRLVVETQKPDGFADNVMEERIKITSLRGKDMDLEKILEEIAPLSREMEPALVIIDSLYKAMPKGLSENDNADVTRVYNLLNQYAAVVETAGIIIVHHTSKGGQAEKEITDIGSGAGAQSRAADTHLVLRRHEDDEGRIQA
ncbi:unnamed protein product, partial [marine sediment metagenome]